MAGIVVHLTDEERLEVVLGALVLFLLALVVSVCLAATCCPLNKWLSSRRERHRRRRLGEHLATTGVVRNHQNHNHYPFGSRSLKTVSGHHSHQLQYHHGGGQGYFGATSPMGGAQHQLAYQGPPPDYEAALRASRLQSLTGGSLFPDPREANKCGHIAINLAMAGRVAEKPLQLGDYFHQPPATGAGHAPEQLTTSTQSPNSQPTTTKTTTTTTTPLTMRLWVRMLEPGELVGRARAASGPPPPPPPPLERRGTLSRQLSIPQLFGSLVSLAQRRQSSQQLASQAAEEDVKQATPSSSDQQPESPPGPVQLDSIESELSSCSTISGGRGGGSPEGTTTAANKQPTIHLSKREASQHEHCSLPVLDPRMAPDTAVLNPITSRVLHMNVASFSYAKDESLINSRRHHQLNCEHLFAPNNKNNNPKSADASSSKMCQLLISVCDIENALTVSRLHERSPALLAHNTSLWIQCEIVAPKSSAQAAAKLLSYPLRAIGARSMVGSSRSDEHTVDLGATISAAAIENRPPPQVMLNPQASTNTCQPQSQPQNLSSIVSSTSSTNSQASGSNSSSSSQNNNNNNNAVPTDLSSQTPTSGQRTNWRHEPSADGRSVVAFSSVPKQVSPPNWSSMSYLSDSGLELDYCCPQPDLVQFDAVFVSPVISRSLVESGHLRLRLHSQCKYLNDTCLAELKLPLKQLLRADTRDNLGDAATPPPSATPAGSSVNLSATPSSLPRHYYSETILNQLLANLLAASTGTPLLDMIDAYLARPDAAGQPRWWSSSQSSSSWLDRSTSGWRDPQSATIPRSSSSFNEALHQLQFKTSLNLDSPVATRWPLHLFSTRAQQQQQQFDEEEKSEVEVEEVERRLEQNFCRSLMVSHWLNYLAAPSYECQLVEDARGKLVIGFTYMPTSNRVIFNAHKATVLDYPDTPTGGPASRQQMMKNLRLLSGTCYLLRFLMVVRGRVVKRRQTRPGRKPEWDSTGDPITFDLASVSVDQPAFVVCLVMRNTQLANSHSLHNLRLDPQPQARPTRMVAAHSEPETTGCNLSGGYCVVNDSATGGATNTTNCQRKLANERLFVGCKGQLTEGRRDLVIGHVVLAESIWREMRQQPRKQIVRQFKLL